MLGGQATPIAEYEFDRLYQLNIDDNGQVTTVLLTSLPAQNLLPGCEPVELSVGGLAAATGEWAYQTLEVPECADYLSVTISGGSGDADLYVNFGSAPAKTGLSIAAPIWTATMRSVLLKTRKQAPGTLA